MGLDKVIFLRFFLIVILQNSLLNLLNPFLNILSRKFVLKIRANEQFIFRFY